MVNFFVFLFYVLCTLPAIAQDFRPAPEIATGFQNKKVVQGEGFMAVTANPHATKAAYEILKQGGTAMDAAIAAQAVLGLVEPQSSGIGGGAFVVYYDVDEKEIISYDGRETAPKAIREDVFLTRRGVPIDFYDAVLSGHSVGVPGVPQLLQVMHDRHGLMPWGRLFGDAISLAKEGFIVSPRLADMVAEEVRTGRVTDDFKDFFYRNGRYIRAGDIFKNPAYAESLTQISLGGANAFYKGPLAGEIISKVRQYDGVMSKQDLGRYQVMIRSPVCGDYRRYIVCSMAEPSSGGVTLLQILGMLEGFPLGEWGAEDFKSWHVIAEASRLAFADRNLYLADPAFIESMAEQLLDKAYLKQRAGEINMIFANPDMLPGTPKIEQGTSHISIIDSYGNALSMTTTVESAFGSHLTAGGFFLNNQLTDFSFIPKDEAGQPVANRIEGGKRPRSSMAPTIVFNQDREPVLVIGSAGGSRIIGYVLQRIISVIDWGMDLKPAIDAKNILSRGPDLEVETGTDKILQGALLNRNQNVVEGEQTSGLTAIAVQNGTYTGYADPRREGMAQGK